MNKDWMNGDELRRSFTTVVFALTALAPLIICGLNRHAETAVVVGLLAITMSSLLLMYLLQFRNPRSLKVRHADGLTGTTDLTVTTFEGEHKPFETAVGINPDPRRSVEEKALSAKLEEIVGNTYSHESCLKALDLIAQHDDLVGKSWAQRLNKARLLNMVGRRAEAEDLTNDVLARLADCAEAVGKSYEVLSFIEEGREPRQGGALYREWLEKRKGYVLKGLAALPHRHILLMNAFAVSVLEEDATAALDYLNRAAWVDKEGTRRILSDSSLTQKAEALSPELREAIRDLTEVDDRTSVFKLAMAQLLCLLIATTLTLGTQFGGMKGLARGAGAVPAAAQTLLLKVESATRELASAGTVFDYPLASVGTVLDRIEHRGTDFAQLAPDFLRAGTILDR